MKFLSSDIKKVGAEPEFAGRKFDVLPRGPLQAVYHRQQWQRRQRRQRQRGSAGRGSGAAPAEAAGQRRQRRQRRQRCQQLRCAFNSRTHTALPASAALRRLCGGASSDAEAVTAIFLRCGLTWLENAARELDSLPPHARCLKASAPPRACRSTCCWTSPPAPSPRPPPPPSPSAASKS